MRSLSLLFCALCASHFCQAREPTVRLPTPHCSHLETDPQWLTYAAQFHGHLGPWATAAARLGDAGRRAVKAEGYFDVSITCEGPFQAPPRSCFLDGLQVATGATLGKRNLHWVAGDKIAVKVQNTRTGQVATVRPRQPLLELLASVKQPLRAKPGQPGPTVDHDSHTQMLETIARKIATLPEQQILTVTRSKASSP